MHYAIPMLSRIHSQYGTYCSNWGACWLTGKHPAGLQQTSMTAPAKLHDSNADLPEGHGKFGILPRLSSDESEPALNPIVDSPPGSPRANADQPRAAVQSPASTQLQQPSQVVPPQVVPAGNNSGGTAGNNSGGTAPQPTGAQQETGRAQPRLQKTSSNRFASCFGSFGGMNANADTQVIAPRRAYRTTSSDTMAATAVAAAAAIKAKPTSPHHSSPTPLNQGFFPAAANGSRPTSGSASSQAHTGYNPQFPHATSPTPLHMSARARLTSSSSRCLNPAIQMASLPNTAAAAGFRPPSATGPRQATTDNRAHFPYATSPAPLHHRLQADESTGPSGSLQPSRSFRAAEYAIPASPFSTSAAPRQGQSPGQPPAAAGGAAHRQQSPSQSRPGSAERMPSPSGKRGGMRTSSEPGMDMTKTAQRDGSRTSPEAPRAAPRQVCIPSMSYFQAGTKHPSMLMGWVSGPITDSCAAGGMA